MYVFVPKLAHFGNHSETAFLFYKVTEVPYLSKMNQCTENDIGNSNVALQVWVCK